MVDTQTDERVSTERQWLNENIILKSSPNEYKKIWTPQATKTPNWSCQMYGVVESRFPRPSSRRKCVSSSVLEVVPLHDHRFLTVFDIHQELCVPGAGLCICCTKLCLSCVKLCAIFVVIEVVRLPSYFSHIIDHTAPVVAHNRQARLSSPHLHPRTVGHAQQTSTTLSMYCIWRISMVKGDHGTSLCAMTGRPTPQADEDLRVRVHLHGETP